MDSDLAYRRGSCFVTDSSLQEKSYVATQHHRAVLLNQDTFEYDISCTPFQIPCSPRYASWAVEGVVVTSKFRRAPDQSCSYSTVANVHINYECAKRRWVWIVLLLLIWVQISADHGLSGSQRSKKKKNETSMENEGETPSGDGSCRTSPIEVGVVSR